LKALALGVKVMKEPGTKLGGGGQNSPARLAGSVAANKLSCRSYTHNCGYTKCLISGGGAQNAMLCCDVDAQVTDSPHACGTICCQHMKTVHARTAPNSTTIQRMPAAYLHVACRQFAAVSCKACLAHTTHLLAQRVGHSSRVGQRQLVTPGTHGQRRVDG
jgi:hypothetical protein